MVLLGNSALGTGKSLCSSLRVGLKSSPGSFPDKMTQGDGDWLKSEKSCRDEALKSRFWSVLFPFLKLDVVV